MQDILGLRRRKTFALVDKHHFACDRPKHDAKAAALPTMPAPTVPSFI
jgi:hypothetical protein